MNTPGSQGGTTTNGTNQNNPGSMSGESGAGQTIAGDRPYDAKQSDFAAYSKMRSADVVDSGNKHIGDIDEILVDRGSGRIEFLVIRADRSTGLTDRTIAVPYSNFRWDKAGRRFTMDQSGPEQLRQYPAWDARAWRGSMSRGSNTQGAASSAPASAFDKYYNTRYGKQASTDMWSSSKLDLSSAQTIEGEIRSIDRVNAGTYGEQMVATISTSAGEKTVFLGPSWYINGSHMAPRRGDRVTVDAVKAPMGMTGQRSDAGKGDTTYVASNVRLSNQGGQAGQGGQNSPDGQGGGYGQGSGQGSGQGNTQSPTQTPGQQSNPGQGGSSGQGSTSGQGTNPYGRGDEYPLRSGNGVGWSRDRFESNGYAYSQSYYLLVPASKLAGGKLDCRGGACGDVDDLIIDAYNGRVAFVSVDPNENFLGIGDTKRLAPWGVVSVSLDNVVRLDTDKAMLSQSPPTPSDLSTLRPGSTVDSIYKAYNVPAPDAYRSWNSDMGNPAGKNTTPGGTDARNRPNSPSGNDQPKSPGSTPSKPK